MVTDLLLSGNGYNENKSFMNNKVISVRQIFHPASQTALSPDGKG